MSSVEAAAAVSTTSHATVRRQSPGAASLPVSGLIPVEQAEPTPPRRFRRGTPCEVCGAPVTHTGQGQRFCCRDCAAIGQTLLAASEIASIVSARQAGVSWRAIARELGVSASTAQRACARSGASIDLPDWIVAEKISSPAMFKSQQKTLGRHEG